MTDRAVNVFPRPTLSASIHPLYFSSLFMIAKAASFWKSYSLFQILLLLNPVASLGNISSENITVFGLYVGVERIYGINTNVSDLTEGNGVPRYGLEAHCRIRRG